MKKVFCWSLYFLLLVSPVMVSKLYGQVRYTAEDLAKLNDSYWKSIHSIDMLFTKRAFGEHLQVRSCSSGRWTTSPSRERLLYTEVAENKTGGTKSADSPEIQHDWYFDGANTYHLFGSDVGRKTPNSESDAKSLRIKAYLYIGFEDVYKSVCPAYTWLMIRHFGMKFAKDPHPNETFFSFVHDNKTTAPVKSIDANNDITWSFRILPQREEGKTSSDPRFIEVVINESKHFLVQDIKYHSTTQKVGPIVSDIVVEEYADVGRGLFFPKKVVQRASRALGKSEDGMQVVCTIDKVQLNEKIPDDLFDFRIPPFVEVTHSPPIYKDGHNYAVISIWGADNKPAQTFSEPGEYEAHIAKLAKERQRPKEPIPQSTGFPYGRFMLVLSGLVLVSLTFIFRRLHRKRVGVQR